MGVGGRNEPVCREISLGSSAYVRIWTGVWSPPSCAEQRLALGAEVDWSQRSIRMFGRMVPEPRLSAWYGDRAYTYSGLRSDPRRWPPAIAAIHSTVEALTEHRFNGVLANRYRTGADSMGYHSDDEPELGPDPYVASVSFGATRRMLIRPKDKQRPDRLDLDLVDGAVLLMSPGVQHEFRHAISKTARPVGERLNLTFRWVNARA